MKNDKMFTEQEQKELKEALNNGGIFVKIFSDLNKPAIIYKYENGEYVKFKTLGKVISEKLYKLNAKVYTEEFHRKSLSWIVEKYC